MNIVSRHRKSIFITFAVAAAGVGAVLLARAPKEEGISARFITANPFDLKQIQGFSKYRSCEGHDYRGPTLNGQTETTPRSLKHYVAVKPEFRGTTNQVDAFAPFDGEVTDIKNEETANDSQVWLTPNPHSRSRWHFVFFHLNLDKDIKEGAPIAAGQHIGTANLARGPDDATDNFDVALKLTRPLRPPAIDAPFNHAAQNVLNEFKKYGVSASDLVIPKEYRDAHPCPTSSGAAANDYVWLTPSKLGK